MQERLETELYASIATLDQLKKMFDLGAIDNRSFQRESQALLQEVHHHIDSLKRVGLDISKFITGEQITEAFPDAADLLRLREYPSVRSLHGMSSDQYYDYIGLAILDVATEHASKGLMGLAELIVEVVRCLPELKTVTYNDVIEAVNRVAEHGLLPGIRTLRGGVKVVELRPLELRRDQADVVNLAASRGHISVEEVMMQLKWSEDHARQVLASLVETGMAVADIRFSTGGRYYFPGLRSRDTAEPHGTGPY
ncbi:MAG: hypothetical protein JW779_12735 [Candidatus Thorarchaeota archaeon]|nr:hypothetical protein [Candidatus Thorarchaeota archaeon]